MSVVNKDYVAVKLNDCMFSEFNNEAVLCTKDNVKVDLTYFNSSIKFIFEDDNDDYIAFSMLDNKSTPLLRFLNNLESYEEFIVIILTSTVILFKV